MPSPDEGSPLAVLAGKSVAIWGLGREGRAALDALAGTPLTSLVVVDDRPSDYTTPDGRAFTALVGDAGRAALLAADVVLKSPGISRYEPRAQAIVAVGHELSSGTALWMARHHASTIGVTGSKGKSTTSSLISHLMSGLGIANAYGGNIGIPLLSLPPAERYVVELSSYQCADLDRSPRVAVLTSLFPEHLNWHGSDERYYADKLNIAAHGPEVVVYNGRDAHLTERLTKLVDPRAARAAGVREGFDITTDGSGGWRLSSAGTPMFDHGVTKLRGVHNGINICVALTALAALGVDCLSRRDELVAALQVFEPLQHRLTVVEDPSGLLFVDDSLSTAPQAAVAALEAFPDGPIAVILGGEDRGVSYQDLRDYLAHAARPVVAIGLPESGPRILGELEGLPAVTCHLAEDMHEAVALARREVPVPGTVLLSPAAPSYGRYKDFAARGAAFVDAIRDTAEGSPIRRRFADEPIT